MQVLAALRRGRDGLAAREGVTGGGASRACRSGGRVALLTTALAVLLLATPAKGAFSYTQACGDQSYDKANKIVYCNGRPSKNFPKGPLDMTFPSDVVAMYVVGWRRRRSFQKRHENHAPHAHCLSHTLTLLPLLIPHTPQIPPIERPARGERDALRRPDRAPPPVSSPEDLPDERSMKPVACQPYPPPHTGSP